MKTVDINDVLKILNKYGQFIFTTDDKRYTEMMDEIANLPSTVDTMLDKIRAEIEQVAEEENKHDQKWAKGLKYALKIIDKYRGKQNDNNRIN